MLNYRALRVLSAVVLMIAATHVWATTDTLTIDADNGTTEHYDLSTCADPGCNDDSLYETDDFTTFYGSFVSGDGVWFSVTSGTCVLEPTTGVMEIDVFPCGGTVRVWDVSATEWFAQSSLLIEDPEGSGDYRPVLGSPLRSTLRSPLRSPLN